MKNKLDRAEHRSGSEASAARAFTLLEWQAEAMRLFGSDERQWKFRCPICGNIQGPEDFAPFKDRGATPDTAAIECIGRFLPASERSKAFGDTPPEPGKPCDYAAFGLFRFGDKVTFEGGHTITVFPFAALAAPSISSTAAVKDKAK